MSHLETPQVLPRYCEDCASRPAFLLSQQGKYALQTVWSGKHLDILPGQGVSHEVRGMPELAWQGLR